MFLLVRETPDRESRVWCKGCTLQVSPCRDLGSTARRESLRSEVLLEAADFLDFGLFLFRRSSCAVDARYVPQCEKPGPAQ